jgi:hypothetical protein
MKLWLLGNHGETPVNWPSEDNEDLSSGKTSLIKYITNITQLLGEGQGYFVEITVEENL